MKKLIWSGTAVVLLLCLSAHAFAQETVDHKAGYEKQMKTNAETLDTINGVVAWLKEHNYEKYPNAKDAVEDALDSLNYADGAKKKAENFATKGNWQQAYGWANQHWQYLVKAATDGLRAKKMVEDAEAAGAEGK